MLWLNDTYLKVWKIENKGKYSVAQCSSGKKQEDGSYVNSNWNVKFIGKANEENILEGSRVKILTGAVENIWDKEKNRNWLNVLVFKYEVEGNNDVPAYDDGVDDLPFK